jgi:hypothetical protein
VFDSYRRRPDPAAMIKLDDHPDEFHPELLSFVCSWRHIYSLKPPSWSRRKAALINANEFWTAFPLILPFGAPKAGKRQLKIWRNSRKCLLDVLESQFDNSRPDMGVILSQITTPLAVRILKDTKCSGEMRQDALHYAREAIERAGSKFQSKLILQLLEHALEVSFKICY